MSKIQEICRDVRRDIVTTLATAGCGHPGGSLSAVEIVTELYFEKMHVDPANPRDPDRDRFVLSNGGTRLFPRRGAEELSKGLEQAPRPSRYEQGSRH